MISKNNKKGAMEMSVGTIVTVVLLMSVLVMGLVLVRSIFTNATNAVDSIDDATMNQINKLWGDKNQKIVMYPASRDIKLKKKDDPAGFAFVVKNDLNVDSEFSYSVAIDEAYDLSNCGDSFTQEMANSYLLNSAGTFSLGPSSKMDFPELVKFNIPDGAPECTLLYKLKIMRESSTYTNPGIFLTIK